MDLLIKVSLLVVLLSIAFSFQNLANSVSSTVRSEDSSVSATSSPTFYSVKLDNDFIQAFIQYKSLRNCPEADAIVRFNLRRFYEAALGVDSTTGSNKGSQSPLNHSFGSFDIIETFKLELDKHCPSSISCADVMVLTISDCIILAGVPCYPFRTPEVLRSKPTIDFGILLKSICHQNQNNRSLASSVLNVTQFSTLETTKMDQDGLAKELGTLHRQLIQGRDRLKTANVFSITGFVFTSIILFSPGLLLWRIATSGTLGSFRAEVFVCSFVSSAQWIMYSSVVGQAMVVPKIINSVGLVLNFIYLSMFFVYGSPQQRRLFGFYFGFALVLLAVTCGPTTLALHGNMRIKVAGILSAAFGAGTYVAPLFFMRQVIRTRNVEIIPWYISLASTLNGVCWVAFGALLKDWPTMAANVIGIVAGLVQLVTYLLLRGKKQAVEEKEVQMSDLVSNA